MKSSKLLASVAGVATCLMPQTAAGQTTDPQPNILLIMVDDMGYSDIGCFGSEIATPHIDRLAGEGIKMTQFYNAGRSCPSRAALLTGMYHHKAGIGAMTGNLGLPAYQGFLNSQCLTLGEALKDGGYTTYLSGKWHVGQLRESWPCNRGFDQSFAYLGGAGSHFRIERKSDKDEDVKMLINDSVYDPPLDDSFYSTDAYSRHAADYILKHDQANPFFLYVSYTAPHWPLQAHPEDIARYEGVYDKGWDVTRQERYERMCRMGLVGKESPLTPRDETVPAWDTLTKEEQAHWSQVMAVYAAMIDRVDQGIGTILGALEQRDMLDNTLIIFVSDNGGCMEKADKFADLSQYTGPMGSADSFLAYEANWANVSNTPFRYFKHWMHEGGISTPFIARYPRLIKGGTQSSQPAHFIDMMPTFLELAGVSYPPTYNGNILKPLDGISFVPVLKGDDRPVHDVLYFEHLGFRAVRKGNWKLVSTFPGNTWHLYDLSVDRSELNDLSNQYAHIVEELDTLYHAWAQRSEVADWRDVLIVRRKRATAQAEVLYRSPQFSVHRDKVTQGQYTATVVSPTEIRSDYKNTNNTQRPADVSFRFLVNGEDVEFRKGDNHILSITPANGEYQTPLLRFGQPVMQVSGEPQKMPPNTKVTFRLDMRHVLKDIREKKVFITNTGAGIRNVASVHIVGDCSPLLNKNFQQLQRRKEFRLLDEDGDGIYEYSILLSKWEEGEPETRAWTQKADLTAYPQLKTSIPLIDALYNMSVEEMQANIEADTTFRTGALWGGVWTRDVSYSIYLGLAGIETEVARNSLRKKVTPAKRIVQDTGSGGAWPVSTDRVVWSLAAWEIYKVSQDKEWLRYAADVIKNTVDDDLKTIYNKEYGLVSGESSFIDWRAEQSYPVWMECADISASMCLGTNAIYYKTLKILEEMLTLLERDASAYTRLADSLRTAINEHLWLPSEGYYAQYLYGNIYKQAAPRYECLGESMAVLFDVADEERAKEIMRRSPVTPYGATVVYPQMPFVPPYHNNGIWPFVQSYWNLAAARTGNEQLLEHGLAAIFRPAALFLSNYENFVAESGDYRGTEINSHRMLWSIAGQLSTVYRIFFGMNFEAGQLRFTPFIPAAYKGKMELTGYPYSGARLNITITGHGNSIKSFKLNGKTQPQPIIPAGLKGDQHIEIHLIPSGSKDSFNLVGNSSTPLAPVIRLDEDGKHISWNHVPYSSAYYIYCNGEEVGRTHDLTYAVVRSEKYREYQVKAIDLSGVASYLSNPLPVCTPQHSIIAEAEDFAGMSLLPVLNYSGKGFVELDKAINNTVALELEVPSGGKYALSVRYANGEGPVNTDNKCALRSLYVNDTYEGTLVMPQRGNNEWSNWGMSNTMIIQLKKGKNKFKLSFEPHNENMNSEVNRAMLDYIRLIKL